MKKILRRVTASVLAAATVCMCAVTANATIVDDPVPAARHGWDVRCIGGGAPSSVDTINQFWIYASSAGAEGYCQSLTSGSAAHSVQAICIDNEHTLVDYDFTTKVLRSIIWNSAGYNEKWKITGPLSDVHYSVSATGNNTSSQGYIKSLG